MAGLELRRHVEVGARRIELCHGDLAALAPDDSVDILVVSAFPDQYQETRDSLIGQLARKRRVSVGDLAKDKERDLRDAASCWLSRPVRAGAGFERILCFEPAVHGSAPEVVDDIFVSLNEVLLDSPAEATVAMPLVATGSQQFGKEEVLRPLLAAAISWLRIGLPLRTLKIVERNPEFVARMEAVFDEVEGSVVPAEEAPGRAERSASEVFVSYAREDTAHMERFVAELRATRPDVSVFVDTGMRTGAAWIEELAVALDRCRVIVPLFSGHYFASKWCKQELHVGVIRERNGADDLLFPVYLRTAPNMPSFYLTWNHVDCREGDPAKLTGAAAQLVTRLP